ncbi:hypothetical protein THRCLA_21587 [Thraustotheca clavata]|uniref:Uncharacterized protein n=1 Tax=Thraustotheca clavata TaxID=74557 RepID=A0A1V9ZV33_9STRA|nr:hypothetical protein THRCLA_21587 [Thraustotheca clavata]
MPKRQPVEKKQPSAKKPRISKAAMVQCVQDNLTEIQQLTEELTQLAAERDALCQGQTVFLKLVAN